MEFVDDRTLVSADRGGKTKVWNIATGEEKTEALAGSKFALSKEKGNLKQQVGRFVQYLKIYDMHQIAIPGTLEEQFQYS